MKVSVITPIYNGKGTIKETVDSILAQSYKDLELIIIDDGSTDGSDKIVKELSDERIKYFKIENSGSPARPRNFGIKESTGDFVALCDQDDVWYIDKLKKQLATYESSDNKEEIGVIHCAVDVINRIGEKISHHDKVDEYKSAEEARNNLLISNTITACSVLIPKSVINEVGFFDEGLKGVDDFDMWLRITKKYGVLSLSDTLCAWRVTKEALSFSKTNLYLEDEKIFRKLEKEEDLEIIKEGHRKNINRVFVASLLEKRFEITKKIIEEVKKRNNSLKVRFLIWLYGTSPRFAFVTVKFLEKINIIHL